MRPVRVVSTFCGAGFSDYALHRASEQTGIPVEVVLAFDSWPKAVAVYNANLPSRAVVADVKQITRTDFPPHDLVIGGPPCQRHSTAGAKDCFCHVGGVAHPSCCLADFVRLSAGSPYLMENVRSRLVNAPWSEQFCALDFGDVTTRRRWFYSDHLLHVVPTPGPRRFGHIRERAADAAAIASGRNALVGQSRPTQDDEALGTLTAGKGGSSGFLRVVIRDHDALGSLRATSFHLSTNAAPNRAKKRGTSHLVAVVGNNDALGSLTRSSFHGHKNNGSGEVTKGSRVSVRPNGGARRTITDDQILGSLTADSWHGTNMGGPSMVATDDGSRCPSLLEMARAHSIPDSWNWDGANKTQRGLMIANGWPIGMGTAVLAAMLRAVVHSR